MNMEFFDWSMLGTFGGSILAVAVLTQLTKSIKVIAKIPTQLWSYILAVVVLIAAQAFGEGLTVASAGLAVINAALVSLAANGGYSAIERIKDGLTTKESTEETTKETTEE